MEMRRQRKQQAFEKSAAENANQSEPDSEDANRPYHLIDEAIQRLPSQQQSAWLLSRHEGLTYEEIAVKMGLSKKTVKNYIRIATDSMKVHDTAASFLIGDVRTWDRENAIASVVGSLNKLSATAEGKYFADALKIKYWADAGLEDWVGNLSAIRSRYEISQRVYFIDGEALAVDEAYRFLLNRWVEKKMQAKKRDEGKITQRDTTSNESQGKKLIKKNGRKSGRQSTLSIK